MSTQTYWGAAAENDITPLLVNPPTFYDPINVVTGVTVEHVDVAKRVVATSTGTRYRASLALVLATGCRAASLCDANISTLSLRGGGRRTCKTPQWTKLGGLHCLRSFADADAILAQIRNGGLLANTRAVIVGAGLTGMELASALMAQRVNNVTIVNADDRLLPSVFTPKVARFYESVYRSNSCTIKTGRKAVSVSCDAETGWVNGVNLDDGAFLQSDLCVIAVGTKPNTELVQGQLNLTPDGGIIVDQRLCASDGVYAIGDIAAANTKGDRFGNSSFAKESAIVAANAIMADNFDVFNTVAAGSSSNDGSSSAATPELPSTHHLTLNYTPQWSSYSTLLKLDWVAFGDLSGARTVEFGIDSVLTQQLQFENAMVSQNQQRRRNVQGHDAALIDANSPVKENVKVETRFGVWFINENSQVCGGFLEGGTEAEKADMYHQVVVKAQWPLPGWA